MSPGRPGFLFVHLQKTAGTALLRRLRHHFGPEAVYPRPDEQGTPEVSLDVDRLLRRLEEPDDRTEVVTGHFPLCVADLLPTPVRTFTVLRDPVERVLSFLRHQREVEPRLSALPLEEVYADPVATGPLVTNHMVRMLSLRSEELTDGALTPIVLDEERLDAARRNLADRVDVVGLQDDFDDFCTDLEAAFGWDLGPPVFMNRTRPVAAPEGLSARIRADNDLDARLHAAAVALVASRHDGRSPAPS